MEFIERAKAVEAQCLKGFEGLVGREGEVDTKEHRPIYAAIEHIQKAVEELGTEAQEHGTSSAVVVKEGLQEKVKALAHSLVKSEAEEEKKEETKGKTTEAEGAREERVVELVEDEYMFVP